MAKEEINQQLAALHAQLDSVIEAIQKERQEAKEDETTVIEELMINQGILEDNIINLESLLYSNEKIDSKKYLLKQNGEKRTMKIVHEQLADSTKGWISSASPLAQALCKARVGEAIKISTPIGETEYELLGIE